MAVCTRPLQDQAGNSSESNVNGTQWVTKGGGGHEGGRGVLGVSGGPESGELEADMINIHCICV